MRLTSSVDGGVCFAHVHDEAAKFTSFEIPAASPPPWVRPRTAGGARLVVIVNGNVSAPVSITVN